MKGFFITGTNTDAGKTLITAALLRLLRNAGHDTIAAKPVQTGVLQLPGGKLLAPDMEVYRQASGFVPAEEELPFAFQYGFLPACSPHLAGELAGTVIDPAQIAHKIQKLKERHQYVLVEGAGGLLVPLNYEETMLDLARLLELPVILTSDNTLGMINHTLLTLSALRSAGVHVAGVIINHTRAHDPAVHYLQEDNIKSVVHYGKTRILGIVPHVPNFNPGIDEHWQIVENALRKGVLDLLCPCF